MGLSHAEQRKADRIKAFDEMGIPFDGTCFRAIPLHDSAENATEWRIEPINSRDDVVSLLSLNWGPEIYIMRKIEHGC